MNEFEQKISRQSLKQIPGEWRAEILANCRGPKVENRAQEQFGASTFVSRLSTIFWPNPGAWAGLAAVWIAILALNLSTRDDSQVVARQSAPPSPEVVAEVRQQKLMFAQLIGSYEARDAEPPRLFLPRPRSERVEILMT